MDTSIGRAGYLYKVTSKRRFWKKKYRKRYFVLKRSAQIRGKYALVYYTDHTCQNAKGCIHLNKSEEVANCLHNKTKISQEFEFYIKTSNKVYNLVAKTEDEMNRWITSISSAITLEGDSREKDHCSSSHYQSHYCSSSLSDAVSSYGKAGFKQKKTVNNNSINLSKEKIYKSSVSKFLLFKRDTKEEQSECLLLNENTTNVNFSNIELNDSANFGYKAPKHFQVKKACSIAKICDNSVRNVSTHKAFTLYDSVTTGSVDEKQFMAYNFKKNTIANSFDFSHVCKQQSEPRFKQRSLSLPNSMNLSSDSSLKTTSVLIPRCLQSPRARKLKEEIIFEHRFIPTEPQNYNSQTPTVLLPRRKEKQCVYSRKKLKNMLSNMESENNLIRRTVPDSYECLGIPEGQRQTQVLSTMELLIPHNVDKCSKNCLSDCISSVNFMRSRNSSLPPTSAHENFLTRKEIQPPQVNRKNKPKGTGLNSTATSLRSERNYGLVNKSVPESLNLTNENAVKKTGANMLLKKTTLNALLGKRKTDNGTENFEKEYDVQINDKKCRHMQVEEIQSDLDKIKYVELCFSLDENLKVTGYDSLVEQKNRGCKSKFSGDFSENKTVYTTVDFLKTKALNDVRSSWEKSHQV